MNLKDKYGYCIIPTNTILFNSEPEYSDGTNKFFGLKHWIANSLHNDERKFSAYRILKEIEILFMIKELADNSNPISCGDDILLEYFPNCEIQSSFTIKSNYHFRPRIIDFFSKQNISGCLTSFNSGNELEVFLIDIYQANNYIEQISCKEQDYRYYDALNHIKIFPSEEFFINSKNRFRRNVTEYEEWNKNYEEYLVKEEGYNKEQARFDSYNLRQKLKI